jgi:hypothetical protein
MRLSLPPYIQIPKIIYMHMTLKHEEYKDIMNTLPCQVFIHRILLQNADKMRIVKAYVFLEFYIFNNFCSQYATKLLSAVGICKMETENETM